MIDEIFNVKLKKDQKLQLQESVPFGIVLAIVGGFLDAYTFIGRGGVLANAQTGNIVFLAICASKGEWRQALVYAPPILAFVIGVIVAELIKTNSSHLFILDWVQAILILEIIILFIIGFIPSTISNIVVTVTISFVASLQTSSFRKLVDSPYATVMCTGNLRSASRSAYNAFTKKDYASVIHAIRFFTVIFSFLLGAFLGGLLTSMIGPKAIWCAVIILVCTIILFKIAERKTKD